MSEIQTSMDFKQSITVWFPKVQFSNIFFQNVSEILTKIRTHKNSDFWKVCISDIQILDIPISEIWCIKFYLLLTGTLGLPDGVVTELKTIPHSLSTQTAENQNKPLAKWQHNFAFLQLTKIPNYSVSCWSLNIESTNFLP